MPGIELKGFSMLKEIDGMLNNSNDNANQKIINIFYADLIPGKYQPRHKFHDDTLKELSDSIAENGILQPIIVKPIDGKKFEIIAGERRWRAAKIAGLTHIPAITRNVSSDAAFVYAMIENIQRENLNPLDEALAFDKLKNDYHLTHEEIAKRVGKSRSTISNILRLLMLDAPLKEMLARGQIEMGHARALLQYDLETQKELAHKIVANGMTVRQIESYSKLRTQKINHKNINVTNDFNEKCKDTIRTTTGLESEIRFNKDHSGTIYLRFTDEKELHRFMQLLASINVGNQKKL